MVESSAGLKAWRARVTHEARLAIEAAGWVTKTERVEVEILISPCQRDVKRPLGDVDKLARAILDAMSRPPIGAGAYDDDSQVKRLTIEILEPESTPDVTTTWVSVYA